VASVLTIACASDEDAWRKDARSRLSSRVSRTRGALRVVSYSRKGRSGVASMMDREGVIVAVDDLKGVESEWGARVVL
jgi:hypothetical protein